MKLKSQDQTNKPNKTNKSQLCIITHLINEMLMSISFDIMITNRLMIDAYIKNLTDDDLKELLNQVLINYEYQCTFIICYMKTINHAEIKGNLRRIIYTMAKNNSDDELCKSLLNEEGNEEDKYMLFTKSDERGKFNKTIINYLYERYGIKQTL